jgi:hypothetical protein
MEVAGKCSTNCGTINASTPAPSRFQKTANDMPASLLTRGKTSLEYVKGTTWSRVSSSGWGCGSSVAYSCARRIAECIHYHEERDDAHAGWIMIGDLEAECHCDQSPDLAKKRKQ